MAKGYYSGLVPGAVNAWWQRKAFSRRYPRPEEQRRYLAPISDYEHQMATDLIRFNAEQENRDRVLKMQEEQMRNEEEAARMQGAVNIGATYGNYRIGKELVDIYKSRSLPAGVTGAGGGASAATESLASVGALSKPGALTVPKGAYGAGGGAAPALEGIPSFQAGATGSAESLVPSYLSTASKVAGPAALASTIGYMASPLTQKITGWNEDISQGVTAGLAGGITGWALAGSGAGPAGFIIGAGVGLVVSLLDDVSVICTELHRQGLLDTKTWRASTAHCLKDLNYETYWAYRQHSDHIVPVMRRSKLATYLALPFGRAMARECAHRYAPDKFKGSILGKAIEKYLRAYIWMKKWAWRDGYV